MMKVTERECEEKMRVSRYYKMEVFIKIDILVFYLPLDTTGDVRVSGGLII
jgi:hypothetical protein